MVTHSTFAEDGWISLRPTAADLLEQAVGEISRTFIGLVEEGRQEVDRVGSGPFEDPLYILSEATRRCLERRSSAKHQLAIMERAARELRAIEEDLTG